MRRSPILALVIAAGFAVAACGGAASPTPTPATTPRATAGPTAGTTAGLTAAPAGATQVDIRGFAFAPATVTVAVGGTVSWVNGDTASHTVVFDDGSPSSGTLATGQAFKRTFDTAGTFTYHCSIHPSMTGTVIVKG